jgi:hypothetical protein
LARGQGRSARGGNANPSFEPELRRLSLAGVERRALVAFLGSLVGPMSS